MIWLLFAVLSPALHGFANILDTYLANRLLKSPWTLAFYSTAFNSLFLPLVWLIEKPSFLPLTLWPVCLLIAAIEVGYLYPYYRALHAEDTSVVSSLFDLGRISVPLFAFLLVGETLGPMQYAGFFLLILASTLLTVEGGEKWHLNAAFWYMLVCSTLLSLEAVLYKYVFTQVSWSTGFVWPTLMSFIFSMGLLLIPRERRSIIKQFSRLRGIAPVFILEEFLTFGGTAVATYVIDQIPVTLKESVSSFQPFFVLLYALIFRRYFPKLFKERVDGKRVFKKLFFFAVMVVGIWLVMSGT